MKKNTIISKNPFASKEKHPSSIINVINDYSDNNNSYSRKVSKQVSHS